MARDKYLFNRGYIDKDSSNTVKQTPYSVKNMSLLPYGDIGVIKSISGTDNIISDIIGEDSILIGVKAYDDVIFIFYKQSPSKGSTEYASKIKMVILDTLEVKEFKIPYTILSFTTWIYDIERIDNKFLVWTDNVKEPRIVNIERAIGEYDYYVGNTISTYQKEQGTNFGDVIIYFTDDIDMETYSLSDLCFNDDTGFSYYADSVYANNQLYFKDVDYETLPEAGGFIINRHIIDDYYLTEEDIRLIKKPPFKEPRATKFDVGYNRYLSQRAFQFMYYYVYDDNFKSTLSFYTNAVYCRDNTEYIRVEYCSGGSKVKEIGLCFRDIISDTVYLITTINKKNENIPDNDCKQTYDFRNNLAYEMLDKNYYQKLFDNVPINAKHLKVFNNVLSFQNYYEGFDMKDINGNEVACHGEIDLQNGGMPKYNLFYEEQAVNAAVTYDLSQIDNYEFTVDDGDSVNLNIIVTYLEGGEPVSFEYDIDIEPFGHKADFYNYFYDDIRPSLINADTEDLLDTNNTKYDDETNELTITFKSSISPAITKDEFNYTTVGFYDKFFLKNDVISYNIAYYDDYNRSMGYIKLIDHLMSKSSGDMTFSFDTAFLPPVFATKYKFIRSKDNTVIYPLNYPFQGSAIVTEDEGKYIYLLVHEDDAQNINIGDIIRDDISQKGQVQNKAFYQEEEIAIGSKAGTWIHLRTSYAEELENNEGVYYGQVDNKTGSNSIHYEVGATFAITENHYHDGNLQPQTETQEGLIKIRDGNYLLNKDRNYILKQLKNGGVFENTGRPSFVINNPHRKHRYSSMTISEKYLEDTNINGLNSFDAGQNNYIDYDKEKGEITAVRTYADSLLVWQERGVLRQGLSENILSTINGEISVQIGKLLSSFRYYAGSYGLDNPETLQELNNHFFYVSNNKVCRLGGDGVRELSDGAHFMSKHFQDNKFIKSFVNPFNKMYTIYNEEKFIVYNIDTDKWVKEGDKLPLIGFNNNKDVFFINKGNLYRGNSSSVNTLYGEEEVSYEINFYFNNEPFINKVINAIILHSSIPLNLDITDDDGNTCHINRDDFKKEEGLWYTHMPKMFSTLTGASGSVLKGLGVISEVVIVNQDQDTKVVFANDITSDLFDYSDLIENSDGSFSEKVYSQPSSNSLLFRDIVASNIIEGGDFLLAKSENMALSGDDMRSHIFNVKITSDEPFELFAIEFENDISKV